MKKRVIWCTVGIVFGAILILGGISKMSSSVSRVDCGGRAMYPGDTCETTSKYGVKKVSTYEEQAKSDRTATWGVVGGAGLLIIFSAWKLIKGLRNRDKAAAAGPADLTQHWNQQQPPAPQPAVQGWQARQPPQQYQQGPPQQYQQPPQGWQYQQQPIPPQQPPNQSWS